MDSLIQWAGTPAASRARYPTQQTIMIGDSASTSDPQHSSFALRHIGPRPEEWDAMAQKCGRETLEALIDSAIPEATRTARPLDLPAPLGETPALESLARIAQQNQVLRSLIGQGYYDVCLPPVIRRNIVENPGWYTQYTPYQAEIAQGRLEALLNFQTMVADLSGMEIANASLLDEATAAAEAMGMAFTLCKKKDRTKFFVAEKVFPQTLAVVQTRAEPLGIEVVVGCPSDMDWSQGYFGVLLQYPDADGTAGDLSSIIAAAQENGVFSVVATDLLALTLLKPPGEFGADMVVGSAQRFGVPLGFGGPHAGFLATRDRFKRNLPGRLVGVSKDADGRPAYRLTLQTREQHIRREKATSNICTAQVLLAVIAAMYAVYHGPDGLRAIAGRIRRLTLTLRSELKKLGVDVLDGELFDTLTVSLPPKATVAAHERSQAEGYNLRRIDDRHVGISLDERSTEAEVVRILGFFSENSPVSVELQDQPIGEELQRESTYLTHPVFQSHRSETEMLRYLKRLENRDLSLTTSMIPLGSCTMKLNAAAEMLPITWPEFNGIHPFAPTEQTRGYLALFLDLERWLSEITGFEAVSLQPNAGAQGEYAGLLAIRQYHLDREDSERTVCLIPSSAHGTNPASAVMAGFTVTPVRCDDEGNIDVEDLRAKATENADRLGALMVTYPSTHGVFEATIQSICQTIHDNGGLVYMDGANLNAQVGLLRPDELGADVCHINLHKTFCIPHGGGGPGMGPIAVNAKLAPFLPTHPMAPTGGEKPIGPVSAAPWSSASILPISWMYIRMMGAQGLTDATRVAILNANYMAARLADYYPILYRGESGHVAHECILDLRDMKKVTVEDVAKRLMDYGYHAPTVSWPVPGTVMIEPTESESREELDRFCDAMIQIRGEIDAVENGEADPQDNPLKNAPHTATMVTADAWDHEYTRTMAAYPQEGLRDRKFWPAVRRIDSVFGDRNPVCTCVGMEAFEEAKA